MNPTAIYLLHDGSKDLSDLPKKFEDINIELIKFDEHALPGEESTVIVYLSDDCLRRLWQEVITRKWKLGVLDHPEASRACAAYGLEGKDLSKSLEKILGCEPVPVDYLCCNNEVVFCNVVVGEMLFFDLQVGLGEGTKMEHILNYLSNINSMLLRAFEISSSKGQNIKPSLLGMMIGQGQNHGSAPRFQDIAENNSGQLTLLAMAPRSVMDFLYLFFRFMVRSKWSRSNLPESLGLIRSKSVSIHTSQGISFLLDDLKLSAKTIECEIKENALQLMHPDAKVCEPRPEKLKEEFKVDSLPMGESAFELTGKHLPWFSHASEEEFKDLFQNLRDNATLTPTFLILMALSVMLALLGLYANSAPVIIGAMILAPLMGPIVSLAMGFSRMRPKLIMRSLKTLVAGVSFAIGGAMTLAWMIPLTTITPEMDARLHPTLLDLGVALVSGIAAAYAHSKSEISKSLAGVSIAVALVPPLSVVGIGLGWADISMAAGSLLLFITNLIGIIFAASFTFMLLGYSPFHLVKKSLSWIVMALCIISIPLMISFNILVERDILLHDLPSGTKLIQGYQVELTPTDVTSSEGKRIFHYKFVSDAPANSAIIKEVKQEISKQIEDDFTLEVDWRIRH